MSRPSARILSACFAWRRPAKETRNMLGRWCGRWYDPSCDAMRKGWLNDMDHSVWRDAPPKTTAVDGAEATRDPVSVMIAN